jgi:hypothetical protein
VTISHSVVDQVTDIYHPQHTGILAQLVHSFLNCLVLNWKPGQDQAMVYLPLQPTKIVMSGMDHFRSSNSYFILSLT